MRERVMIQSIILVCVGLAAAIEVSIPFIDKQTPLQVRELSIASLSNYLLGATLASLSELDSS